MSNVSKQKLTSQLGESTVTSKVTYVGENRPDLFISRKTETTLFKGLRTYNWSKSIGARTQTTDRISNAMYSILQSYNTFQSFASTQNFALSVLGRAAWVVGGRALGRVQGKIVPQGGGPFGRLMRVQAGHMSRQILTNAMKFFISVDFSIDNVQKVQADVTADLMKANSIGPQWQMKTHAQAIKNAPDYKLGGFGQGKITDEQTGMLGMEGVAKGKRNSQYTQNLIDSGFTASEVTALQRFADSQIDSMSDAQITDVLNAFGKDRHSNLDGMAGLRDENTRRSNRLFDFGTNVMPGNASVNGISYDSKGNMYYDSPDMDISTGGLYTPSDLAQISPYSYERYEKVETKRKKGRQKQNEKILKAIEDGDFNKANRIAAHTSNKDAKLDTELKKRNKDGQAGVKTYLNENGQIRLRPRDMNVPDLNTYIDDFDKMIAGFTTGLDSEFTNSGVSEFEKHRQVGQVMIDSLSEQYAHDNTIYSQRLIQKSITRDAPLIGGNANDNRGFLGFSVTFGQGLKDAHQVEFGGPATDTQGGLRKRSDKFVYPRSLFLTRAGERAAQMLDVDGDISYSQAKGGVLHHMKRNRDKFDSKGKTENRTKKNEYRLIVDRQVREFNQQNAIRARDVAFNNQTGRHESVKRMRIEDAGINRYFDDIDKGKTYMGGKQTVVQQMDGGEVKLVELSPKDYPPGFVNGLDKIVETIKSHMYKANSASNMDLANNEFYRKLGRTGRGSRAGIVMGDDHLKSMGMSRNIFGNRPFIDTQKMQNQNLYGGIFDETDLEGAILMELQKDAGPAIVEAYKTLELKAQAMQMTKLADELRPHYEKFPILKKVKLSKNGQVELGGTSYSSLRPEEKNLVDRAMASSKQAADKWYEKEVIKLESAFQNPQNLGVFQEYFGGLDDWTGEKSLKVITDRINRHLEGVISSSGARPQVEFAGRTMPFTGKMAGRQVMIMREYTKFEQGIIDSDYYKAIQAGNASAVDSEARRAIGEKRKILLEQVEDSLKYIKSLGVSDLGEFVQFAGYGQDLLGNDAILKLAEEAGVGVKKTGGYWDRSVGKRRGNYDNVKTYLDRDGGVIRDIPENIEDINNYKDLMNHSTRVGGTGAVGRSINASKTNVYGNPTANTNAGGNNTKRTNFNLNTENILPEHRIDLSHPESRQIIKDYKLIRNQINKGGFTWTNKSKNLRYYRDVRKSDYGDRAETASGQNLQNTLNRLLKNVRFSGKNDNVMHLLIAIEDSPAVSAYFRTTLDPSHPLNSKQYGVSGIKDNKKFGPPKPVDKAKIAYYQQVLSKTTGGAAGDQVSALQLLKNILLN